MFHGFFSDGIPVERDGHGKVGLFALERFSLYVRQIVRFLRQEQPDDPAEHAENQQHRKPVTPQPFSLPAQGAEHCVSGTAHRIEETFLARFSMQDDPFGAIEQLADLVRGGAAFGRIGFAQRKAEMNELL